MPSQTPSTTYSIGSPASGNSGRSSPKSHQRPRMFSRILSSDRNNPAQPAVLQDPPTVQSQQGRNRAYSNGRPPPQVRGSVDSYKQGAPTSYGGDRPLPLIPGYQDAPKRDVGSISGQLPRPGLWSFIDRLPQSADDAIIRSLTQQVFVLADALIDTHYDDRLSQNLGNDSNFLSMNFPYLANGTKPADVLFVAAQPTFAIKHCIVYLLLQSVLFDGSGGTPASLLPPEFTITESALTRSTNDDSQERFAVLSAHRVLLSFLRAGVLQDAAYQVYLNEAMRKIGTAIEMTFLPWLATDSSPTSRRASLDALMRKTAELGILLFAQPSTYKFVWLEAKTTKRDLSVEVFPRLLKINDEDSRDLEHSPCMLSAKVERIRYIDTRDQVSQILRLGNGLERNDTPPSAQPLPVPTKRSSLLVEQSIPQHASPGEFPVSELPSEQTPRLLPLSRQTSFTLEPEELQVSTAQVSGRTGQPSVHELQAMNTNGTPRSPAGNSTAHDTYSQQLEKRRQAPAYYPPQASIGQLTANQSPTRRKSSRKHRSSSASSENRGRRESLGLTVRPRRASISNDRSAESEYGHRTPSDPDVLRSPISPSLSFATPGNTGHALPVVKNDMTIPPIVSSTPALDDRHVSRPQSSSSHSQGGFSFKTMREGNKKPSRMKFWKH